MVRAGAPRAAWRRGADYAYLLGAERAMFAWEWLRRSPSYRESWAQSRRSSPDNQLLTAHQFGLVVLVPPTLTGPEARPIWHAAQDAHVLSALVAREQISARDLLDVRALPGGIDIAFDEEDAEHWRIELAGRVVRIDVRGGTLLGGPTLLRYELSGLASVRPKLQPLGMLVRAALGDPTRAAAPREARAARWITELRTADALADGASQQDIARALFGSSINTERWRAEGESFRLRVQRLVRIARTRLRHPLDPAWFR